jgi:hypothetical protein
MVTQHTVISFEQFVQDFGSLFQHRVFRLEALDWYDAPNEREPYARFLAGQPADLAWREPWKQLVRDVRASGRIMQRVHIVTEPVTDYVRFELLHVYPANVEAGEDVRVLARQAAEGAGVTFPDFWLFDDSLAALLDYDDDGRIQSVRMTDSPLDLERMREERGDALALAVPLAQYVTQHNITEGKQAA